MHRNNSLVKLADRKTKLISQHGCWLFFSA